MGPRSCGDRMTIWDDDDDDVVEKRASEPLIAGPLVQFCGHIELVLILDRVRGPGMEVPLGGRRTTGRWMMGGRGRVPLAVFLTLFLSACATAGGSARLEGTPGGTEVSAPISSLERANRSDSRIPTLLVENASGNHVAVRLNGFRLGTATAGRNCIQIPRTAGEIVLELVPVGMPPQLAWPIHLGESLHWRVTVGPGGTLKYDLSSLTPAESGCRR